MTLLSFGGHAAVLAFDRIRRFSRGRRQDSLTSEPLLTKWVSGTTVNPSPEQKACVLWNPL